MRDPGPRELLDVHPGRRNPVLHREVTSSGGKAAMKSRTLSLTVAAALVCGGLPAWAAQSAPVKGSDKAPLGSPEFYPSPAHPVGWRGDGTGQFPGATPPISRGVIANGPHAAGPSNAKSSLPVALSSACRPTVWT